MPPSPAISEQFNRWAADHVAVLYRVAYRLLGDAHEAEDVLQDTFRSAWTSRHLYDGGRSERAWLLAILRRRVADHWRRRGTREKPSGGELPEVAGSAAVDPFHDELSAAMQAALGRLPEELRETLLLVVVGELTHQEAADLQGIPLGTVLSRVSRGRSRLRDYLLEGRDGRGPLKSGSPAADVGTPDPAAANGHLPAAAPRRSTSRDHRTP